MEGIISYNDFLDTFSKAEICKNELEEATGGTDDDECILIEDEKTETDTMISKLCRVCGNRGQIYIFSVPCDKYLTIPKSRLSKFHEVTIAEMIEKISSEKVDLSDSLPQFICPHCLSYLQHAYNVRLEIIHTSENLKEARKIANDEPTVLETQPSAIKPLSLNQQEINKVNEEIESDKYFYETFGKKNAKIKIGTPTKTRIDQRKAEEIKCPGCFRKSYGAKSHNMHMNFCLINVLKIFFGEFQLLYKARFEKKITQEEYLINAISLIFNYKKKIDAVAKDQKIDVDAVSKILPAIPNLQNFNPEAAPKSGRNHNKNQDRFSSPNVDYGYYSNTH